MLADVVAALLWAAAVALAVPTGVLFFQVLLATGRRDAVPQAPTQEGDVPAPRPRVAVLVPAHDEELGLAASLGTIVSQLGSGDRLLVVADNCSDATAAVARAAGAEAVERHDPDRRGKGYALDFGIRHLEAAPPEVVLVIDADCVLHPGSLACLARLSATSGRPVQALDLMHAPAGAGLKTRIGAFAWVVKNFVRPLGMQRAGLPCQLMGTGMAFPWPLIQAAPLASGHLVEDMRLGLDLAALGAPPLFCPEAQVSSTFPSDDGGTAEQRARWERGHLGVIVREAPRALARAVTRRRPLLAAMVLDLCVPPLTVLVMLLVAQALLYGAAVAMLPRVSHWPLIVALASLAMLGASVALAWVGFGRAIVSAGELLSVPLYVLAKLPRYARFLKRGKTGWIRAKRGGPDG